MNCSPASSVCFSQTASAQGLRKISSAPTSCSSSSALDTFEHRTLSPSRAGLYILAAVTSHTGDSYSQVVCPQKGLTFQAKHFQKTEGVVNYFKNYLYFKCLEIPFCRAMENTAFGTHPKCNPDPLQSWEVNCKIKEAQR